MSDITEDQKNEAIRLWKAGECLGDIAHELGVGMYTVSFLTRPPHTNWRDLITNSTTGGAA